MSGRPNSVVYDLSECRIGLKPIAKTPRILYKRVHQIGHVVLSMKQMTAK